jgi:predicted flap endonuclease-1-like 5' DNA nuclease
MKEYERSLTNSLLTWGFGLLVGVLFGLIILGWWLWPVEWVDASPEDMLYQYQVDYLNTAIEAYGYTGDTATAQARYFALGSNAETALAQIVQNPGTLSPLLLSQFSEQVAGVPVETLAGMPVEKPATTTGLNPWIGVLIALFFIFVGVVVTYLIFRTRESEEAEVEYIEYEAAPIDQPETAEPVGYEPAVSETVYEQPMEESIPLPVEAEPDTSQDWYPEPGEMEAGDTEVEAKEFDLPPFIAAAGAGALAGFAAAELSDGEPAAEETEEEISTEAEEPMVEESVEQPEEMSGPDLAEGAAMAGLAAAWLAEEEAEEEPEMEPPAMEEEFEEQVLDEAEEAVEEEIEAPDFDEFEGEELEGETGELAEAVVEEEEEFEAEADQPGEELVKPHDPIEVKMRKKLEYVEGIGPANSQKLAEAGIQTTGKLMVEGVTRTGRQELAEKTGISERLILKWLNQIDLYRIKGIGSEYADLLEAAGVDTVPELAQRNPENLYQALINTNQEKRLVRQLPTQDLVSEWVEQAKQLPRIIQY